MRAVEFVRAIRSAAETPISDQTSADRVTRLGTIDSAYDGTGLPLVLFDGETLMGVKGYPWIGRKPSADDRVVLTPVGTSYVIAGSVGDDLQPLGDTVVFTIGAGLSAATLVFGVNVPLSWKIFVMNTNVAANGASVVGISGRTLTQVTLTTNNPGVSGLAQFDWIAVPG